MPKKSPLAATPPPTTSALPDPARVAEFIRGSLDRAAAYSWPPASRALAAGQIVSLKRRGWHLFYQWRQKFRPPIDLRAVELEIARAPDLFAPTPPEAPSEGMTIAEFAAWAGVDRRALGRHLVIVPPGPVPPLAPGQVPARKLGDVTRIFITDFRGDSLEGERHARDPNEASSSAGRSSWDRQIADLRDRARRGG